MTARPTPHVTVSRVVDAPPALTYQVLADYRQHHPRILPKPTFESLDVEEGGVGAGTVMRVGMKVMGARRTMRFRVAEPQPGRVLEEREVATGDVTTFTVDRVDGGAKSRVEIATTWAEAGALRRWINARVARPLYEKELAQFDAYAQELRMRVKA